MSAEPRAPAKDRDRSASGVERRPDARIASPKPGMCMSRKSVSASGVRSRGPSPVPPVVTTSREPDWMAAATAARIDLRLVGHAAPPDRIAERRQARREGHPTVVDACAGRHPVTDGQHHRPGGGLRRDGIGCARHRRVSARAVRPTAALGHLRAGPRRYLVGWSVPLPGLAATLLEQPHGYDLRVTVDALDHVIHRERSDGCRGQCLHLDARRPHGRGRRTDAQRAHPRGRA